MAASCRPERWITLRTSLVSKSARRRAALELIYPQSFLAGAGSFLDKPAIPV
ncbi:MAG: hypothetical protein KIS67_17800 [Verrucomicrobiae bacterium]|nr:hypothetical protein [Verrucomicrobiae bacterium]